MRRTYARTGVAVLVAFLASAYLFLTWRSKEHHEPDIHIVMPPFHGAQPRSKVVVVAKIGAENSSWVETGLPGWRHAIYQMDSNSTSMNTLRPPMNKGRESMAYLTYIIDHYYILPDIIVFTHYHAIGWHVDNFANSNAESIKALRLDYVRKKGYVNLRCSVKAETCGNHIQPYVYREGIDFWVDTEIAAAWKYMFGTPAPLYIAQACCAQFAVTKEQVRKRTRGEYLRYRQWLIDTPLWDGLAGRVMEYLWHVIFWQDAVFCPDEQQCYCDQFGFCPGLEGVESKLTTNS